MKKLDEIYYMFFPNEYKNGVTEYLMENNNKNGLVGVEIGVGKGGNAVSMLNHLPIKKLYLVDPYNPFFENNKLVYNYCGCYCVAIKKLKKFGDKVVFVNEFACDAAEHIFEDLDFVWFDASGEYAIVKDFLNTWFPKLRSGGIFGGKRFNSNWFGLCKAVLEFVHDNNFECFGCNSGDWWIVKK